MTFDDLLKKRRSIRDFQDKEVSVDIITDIIKDSCLAPSSSNRQPWKFIIITDKSIIKNLSDESKKNLISDIESNPDNPIKAYETVLRNKDFNVFYNAPALVYIIGPKNLRSTFIDCSLAASYFMFSATTRGLGTCWIGLGAQIRDTNLLELISLPDDHVIVAPIIVGYPKHIPDIPKRNEPQIIKAIQP